ncbi:MAG: type II toxin-antitoxin system VapC family toxin [Candidatus Helarchaeota archaeon]
METDYKMEAVIDASVVVKWYIIEEYREQAINIRDDYIKKKIQLLAPCILFFEVLNAIRYSKKNISKKALDNIGKSLIYYGIQLLMFDEALISETVKLALEKDITIYDSVYVALAKIKKVKLYTADDRLINKLGKQYEKSVLHIEKYTI